MTELTGVPIPAIKWQSGNLTEALRKFKRTWEYIFNGPLATKDEAVKVHYRILWVDGEGRDIRDGWALTEANRTKLCETKVEIVSKCRNFS